MTRQFPITLPEAKLLAASNAILLVGPTTKSSRRRQASVVRGRAVGVTKTGRSEAGSDVSVERGGASMLWVGHSWTTRKSKSSRPKASWETARKSPPKFLRIQSAAKELSASTASFPLSTRTVDAESNHMSARRFPNRWLSKFRIRLGNSKVLSGDTDDRLQLIERVLKQVDGK